MVVRVGEGLGMERYAVFCIITRKILCGRWTKLSSYK